MKTTAVTVVYNTPELISDCIHSFRKIYPTVPILIVDNSAENSVCFNLCEVLQKEYNGVRLIHTKANIGHGRALHMGINICYTEHVLVMDSDTRMLEPCIRDMEYMMDENVYGVGEIQIVDKTGHNSTTGIKYLHPYFALINKRHYDNNPGFIHHGAPFIKTMIHLSDHDKLTLKEYPLKRFVLHKERGTRNVIAALERKQAILSRRKAVK